MFSVKSKILICLGSGLNQLPVIKKAKELGLSILTIDQNPSAPGFALSDLIVNKSTYDTEGVIAELQLLRNDYSFTGIIARTSGPALYTAAVIAEIFSLPGLTKDLVKLATLKSELRMFCNENGLSMPKGAKVQSGENNYPGLTSPIIVKPDLPLYGKKDITVIWENNDFQSAVNKACGSSGNEYAEIEEYIEGIDVSALFHLKNGKSEIITYWDELIALDENNAIAGLGVSVPSVINDTLLKCQVEEIISRFSSYFINISGLMILSFRIGMDGNIYIIELHADLGGDLIADELFPKACPSFNFFELAIDVACGEYQGGVRPKFTPTALVYDKSKYEIENIEAFKILGNHLLLKEKSQLENHRNLDRLFGGHNYNSKPQHYQWLNQFAVNQFAVN